MRRGASPATCGVGQQGTLGAQLNDDMSLGDHDLPQHVLCAYGLEDPAVIANSRGPNGPNFTDDSPARAVSKAILQKPLAARGRLVCPKESEGLVLNQCRRQRSLGKSDYHWAPTLRW
jgi:hypothetical protein